MDEHSTSALQYGHLGNAIYLPDTQSWAFSRSLAQPSAISYAGATKTSISSPLTALQSSLSENKILLPRVHPEIAASWSLVRNETLSHVITAASDICNPQVSSLFDLGNAVDLENDDSGSRVIPIAVMASGECGNILSFRRLEEDTVELRQENTTWARVPSIGEVDSVEWSKGGAPVRQISFAQTAEEKATWMAARFPYSTFVFRPIFHRYPVPMRMNYDGACVIPANPRNSRLDANPLIEISNAQTGGFAHAHVTFNPWYQKQIAIVDERGNWSVWEITGRHRRNKGNWSAASIRSGSLPWLDPGDNQDMDNLPRHDGWAAIEWAGDVNSFIVSDRRCPMLYRMESDRIWPHPIELNLKRKSEWILDVKRSTCNVSHVFILTTSRIFLLDVTLDPASTSKGNTGTSVYPRLSWCHFRDPEDTTLRLGPLFVNEDFYLTLYSRLNHFVLVYQCPIRPDSEIEHKTSIPDPFILDIPSISDYATEPQGSPHGTQFSTLIFKEIAHSPASVGKKNYDPNARLIKLFLFDSRLSVRESVYIGPAGTNDEQELSPERDILRLKKKQKGVQKRRMAMDDFVVDDRDESVLGGGTLTIPDTGILSVTPFGIPQWAIDYTSIYAVATGKLIAASNDGTFEQLLERTFKESIQELESKISRAVLSDQSTSETMLEFLGGSPTLDDIDHNAQDFEQLLSMVVRHNRESLEQHRFIILPMKVSPAMMENTDLDLINIYDSLVNDWLSNLPHDIPGRTRIMKEKAIRNIAADLVLSRISIIPRATRRPRQSGDHTNNPVLPIPASSADAPGTRAERQISLPSAIHGESGSDMPRSSFRINSTGRGNEFPEPEQSTDDTETVYSSLLSLTTFNQEKSSQHVATMLSHWLPGTSPDTYDWQRTVQVIDNVQSRQAVNSTTPKRRLRKKASQNIVPDSSATVPPVSSTVPAVRDWGSQPDNEPHRLRLQSSQILDEDFPMTQVERGIFGGREAARKPALKVRKKKRAAGF